ncbi:MAG: MBL fold metallo-hydrolase [Zetaproteobacteria bacterium]|nr:MBL fold metallo-hydrolase [Zetaproteobacteria bacterium]
MFFRQFFDESTYTYSYLIADSESGEALLIDPVFEQAERDINFLNELGLRLIYSVDTHVHADHITGSGVLRKKTGCQIGVSVHAGISNADLALKDGDMLHIGKYDIQVLETPGHTHTCLSFVCDNRVFTGDTLLIRGCGRTDFQQGDAQQLYASIIGKLYTLPDQTLVYPAHDYKGMTVSSIEEEKKCNPRVSLGCEKFIQLMNNLNLPQPKRIHEAVPANMVCGCVDG